MKTHYIIFQGRIDPKNSQAFIDALYSAKKGGAEKIVVLFSSDGGSIRDGFDIATTIQNFPIPIQMHATNSIASIATVIYMAAKERTAESYARFYYHGAFISMSVFEKDLRVLKRDLGAFNYQIAQFISENTGMNYLEVKKVMNKTQSYTVEDAVKKGMVASVIHLEIPKDADRTDVIKLDNS